MNEPLHLRLLGGLRIERGGVPVGGFVTLKAQVLLCYLAVTGRPHFRSTLADFLWGEMPEHDARASLRVALSNLRQVVGDHLTITRETAAFNRECPYSLDVEQFQALLRGSATTSERWSQLEAALGLYEGDFLHGVYPRDAPAFDEWAAGERERLRQMVMQVLHELAAQAVTRQSYTAGIDYLGRLLALDPWREDAHRELMLMLARTGQVAAALIHYERCCRTLREELGVEPEQATTELQQQIQAGLIKAEPPPRQRRPELPVPPTALLGRDEELAQVIEILTSPTRRLLTLLGPGGIGKTRLALEVASSFAGGTMTAVDRRLEQLFPDGVSLVDLTSIDDPDFVPTAIAQALDVHQTGSRPLQEQLLDYLGERQLLLLLDNFEHVRAAAPLVGQLLAGSRGLKILVTSRTLLHLRGEHVLPIPPLSLPELDAGWRRWAPDRADVEQIMGAAAVALFVERAQSVQPRFRLTATNAGAVAEMCVRLDGVPLAIELAAARITLLPPETMVRRLSDRLNLLAGRANDLPARQQSLRATLDWSHELLDPLDQVLFRRLAVFSGGCSLEAVEAVCDIDGDLRGSPWDRLQSLMDWSLVRHVEQAGQNPDPSYRFRMLEIIRDYALEQLTASGEAETVRRRHAAYYLGLVEQVEPELSGAQPALWMEQLEREHDNLRAALAWTRGQPKDAAHQLRLAGALWWFWGQRGYVEEGRAWLEEALARAEEATPVRARALYRAGILAWYQDDYDRAITLSEECIRLADQLGDRQSRGWALHSLGRIAWLRGDYRQAAEVLEESVEHLRATGDSWGLPWSLDILGHAVVALGDNQRAMALWEESLLLRRQAGDVQGIPWSLNTLGRMAYLQGDYGRSRVLLEESRARFRELGITRAAPVVLSNLGQVAGALGDQQQAIALLNEALAEFRAMGEKNGVAGTLAQLAEVAIKQGEHALAADWLAEGLALYQTMGHKRGIATMLDQVARVTLRQGNIVQAVQLLGTAAALRASIGTQLWPAETADYERNIAAATVELGATGFAAAWSEGQAMPLAQAITNALASIQPTRAIAGASAYRL